MKLENIWRLGSINSQPTPPKPIENQLQDAIYDHTLDASELQHLLISEPMLASRYLPNGELPLHLAVRETYPNRENQLAKIEILLRHGADIEQRDSQGLTALDHAAFLDDSQTLVKILSVKIGMDMTEFNDKMEIVGDVENLEDILLERNSLVNVNPKEIAKIHRAAYAGDLSLFSLKEMINFPPNDRGERPLHFAIKGRQTELVRQIVAEMKNNLLDINVLDLDTSQNSYLHYAVASNSSEIAAILIQAGIALDQRNTRGETALHYAAAIGKVKIMLDLVRAGAHLKIVDAGGRLPLGLFLLATKAKDPLAISSTHFTLSAITALYWLTKAAKQSDWPIPHLPLIVPALFAATTALELKHLLDNINGSKKQFAAILGYFTLGYLPPINLGYHLWRASYLVKETFSVLGAAWKNCRYRKLDTICKLAVTGTNTTSAVHSVYTSFQTNKYFYELYKSEYFSDLIKLVKDIKYKVTSNDLSFMKDIFSLLEQIFGYDLHDEKSQFFFNSGTSQKCQQPNANAYINFSTVDRLGDQKLDPHCPEHAAIILSPEFDKKGFCTELMRNVNKGEKNPHRLHLLQRIYRNISLEVHPDKLDEAGKKACGEVCFNKVTAAKETLEAELQKQVYCS